MKASEMVKELQNLIAANGDQEVAVDDGWNLRPVDEVGGIEEDDCFVIWMESNK